MYITYTVCSVKNIYSTLESHQLNIWTNQQVIIMRPSPKQGCTKTKSNCRRAAKSNRNKGSSTRYMHHSENTITVLGINVKFVRTINSRSTHDTAGNQKAFQFFKCSLLIRCSLKVNVGCKLSGQWFSLNPLLNQTSLFQTQRKFHYRKPRTLYFHNIQYCSDNVPLAQNEVARF